MFSPLRVLSFTLALVLGGQIVIAQQFASLDAGPVTKIPNARSEGLGGGPYLKAKINFADKDRLAVYHYYRDIARSGPCPAGLTRKADGCLPADGKKWVLGRQLPHQVVFHNLPADLAPRLAPAPAGYRYIRVGGDVLLISRGSGIVVAAIEDLARL
jgi:Ni/Co efflux regulator RcnB